MDDIAQAALGKKIEKKSDIIHSLPTTSEDSSSGEQGSTAPSSKAAVKQRNGAALKNLFTALADGQTSTTGSGEEDIVKENRNPESAKDDNQVSTHSFKYFTVNFYSAFYNKRTIVNLETTGDDYELWRKVARGVRLPFDLYFQILSQKQRIT